MARDRGSIGMPAASAAAAFLCTRTAPAQVIHRAIAATIGRRMLVQLFTLIRLIAKGKVRFRFSVGLRCTLLTVDL